MAGRGSREDEFDGMDCRDPSGLSMNTQGNESMHRYFKRLVCGGRPICARLAP
jgi:hypothetical protein